MLRWGVVASLLFFALMAQASSKEQIISDLKTLQPYLTAEEIQAKIQTTDTPEKFVTTFSAYYYLTLKRQPQLVGSLIALGQEGGWCVGDAHLGNFGAVLDRNGRPHFTVNDLDDTGPCFLITDILKFLVAAQLRNPNEDLLGILRSYKQALTETPWSNSKDVLSLIEKSSKQGVQINPALLQGPQKLKRDKSSREITSAEKSEITAALFRAYKSTEVLDAFATTKSGGGSHGLLRFKVLIKATDNLHLIQFKQLVQPAVFPLAAAPIPIPPDRIRMGLMLSQGDQFSIFYNVQKVGELAMLLEPQRWGNIKVDPDNYTATQLTLIAQDEASVMGSIHAKSASDKYVNDVSKTSDLEWIVATKAIAARLKEIHGILKN